jgi:hypothetical protein
MSLDFLVKEARKNGNSKTFQPSFNNFIDASGSKVVKSLNLVKKETALRANDTPWQKCTHLKDVNGCHHCQKFISFCAKEKCKPEWKE